MQNISDYIEWRGDLSFEIDKFNEIDNLILSEIAYMNFDGIVPGVESQESISFSEVAKIFEEKMDDGVAVYNNPLFKQLPEFFKKAAQTVRYQNILLSNYQNQVDYEISTQFAAITFSNGSKEHYIAFRGTDNSLVGWQEDFMMTYMDEVPAQKSAVTYADQVFSKLSGTVYFGGHSKGGNLAVYAGINCNQTNQDKIIGIYNNDGPGFLPEVIKSEKYQKMLPKITTLVPKSSIVGLFLEHEEEYKVVDSSVKGLSQHDPFSWVVNGKHFVYAEGLTKNSLHIDFAIRKWLDQLPMEKRAEFVDTMFNILQATGAKTINELSSEKLAVAEAMLKSYKTLDELTQSNMKKTIDLFFKVGQKTLKNSFNKEMKSLVDKMISKPENGLDMIRKRNYIKL